MLGQVRAQGGVDGRAWYCPPEQPNWHLEFGLVAAMLVLVLADKVARPLWKRYTSRPYPTDW